MKASFSSGTVFLGRNAGEELLRDIRGAKKSVKIVSPYLSPGYVSELVKLHNRGVEVTLITTDDGGTAALDVPGLYREEPGQSRSKALLVALALFVLGVLLAVAGHPFWGLLLLASAVIVAKLRSSPGKRVPVFDLRVIPSPYRDGKGEYLMHAKVYVIDDEVAYVGSANFTKRSMTDNLECISRVQNISQIEGIIVSVSRILRYCAA